MSGGLPYLWARARLDELSKVVQGQSPPGNTYNTDGVGLPFFQGKAEFRELYPKVEKWCSEPKKVAEEGDILISIRAPVGPTNLAPLKSCIGRGLAAIQPEAQIYSRFLLYQLRHTSGRLESQATGTTFKAISGPKLRAHELNLAPVEEQRRIVEAIETQFTRLDAAESALERARTNLDRYRASVLKAAVEGRLVPTEAELARKEGRSYEPASKLLERILAERRRRWEKAELAKMKVKGRTAKNDKWKAKYKEPRLADVSGLPELPEGWCWSLLPQLGELGRGVSKHRPRNDPRLLGGPYPFIQTGEVRQSESTIRDFTSTYSDFGLSQSRLWPAGTLCITIAANIAETGILAFDACFPDSVVGLLNDDEPVSIKFVESFIRTAKADLSRFAPATAQKNINLKILSELLVPLPPSREQERIVVEVERISSIAAATRESLERSLAVVQRLRQAMLKWAFEGKLVDQDPNDEPAPVLLDRIRAERQKRADDQPRQRRGRRKRAIATEAAEQQELFG